MNIVTIEKALVKGYFGEYHAEIDFLICRIKELEDQLKVSREAHADTMQGQSKRIKELEEGIKKHRELRGLSRNWRQTQADEELYKLLEEK